MTLNKTKTRYFLDGGIPTRTRTWQQKPLPKCHVLEDSRASMGRQKQIEDNGNNKPRLSSPVGGKKNNMNLSFQLQL